MDFFKSLMDVAYRLNDPKTGCPWDIKQNFESLQKFILEEACELVDAVDSNDDKEIIEELGDVLYVVLFYCVVAEKEGRFTLEDVINHEKKKLISRHPHVFGDKTAKNPEEVKKIWQEVKKKEKASRSSLFEGIPKTLSSLARAQKMLSMLIDHEYQELKILASKEEFSQEQLGEKFLKLILKAEHLGLDAEKALRGALNNLEDTVNTKKKTSV